MSIKEINSKEDLMQVAVLAELCFHEMTIEENFKHFNQLKDLYFLGMFEEDTLFASAGFHEYQIFIRDQLFNCSGIAGVMTHPIQRKKGYVKQLMLNLLEKSYIEGFEVSVLWPFDHGFYRKFGYEIAEKPVFYKIKTANIRDIKMDESITIRESKGNEDYRILNTISRNALNKNTRIIGNHDAWFLRGKTSKLKIYIFEKNSNPVGYISFKFEKPKNQDWGTNIQVLDWAYDSIETKKSMLALLKQFESDIRLIKITLPFEEEMLAYLKDFNTSHTFAEWPAMIRIINLKKTLEKLNFPNNLEKNLFVKIEDEHILENKGHWNLKIKEGKCVASKITQEEIEENQVLKLTINEISQLIVGISTVNSLTELKREETPEEWMDENLFPTVPCWIGVWF